MNNVKLPDNYNADQMLAEFDAELAEIEEKIRGYKWQIALLTEERHRLLAKRQDVDMDIVLKCIVEKGLSSNEVLNIINEAVKES